MRAPGSDGTHLRLFVEIPSGVATTMTTLRASSNSYSILSRRLLLGFTVRSYTDSVHFEPFLALRCRLSLWGPLVLRFEGRPLGGAVDAAG